MDSIPQRPTIASPYRLILSALENHIPLANINPAYYHTSALVASLLFLYVDSLTLKIALVAFILLTDWFDGATARRFRGASRAGYITDAGTDRVSEALIFSGGAETLLGKIFFILWLVNSSLTFYSVRSNKHRAMPLRMALLIVLILQGARVL